MCVHATPPSRHDVALLHLSSKAQVNSAVSLATLPPPGQVLNHNHVCYITGWGRTSCKSFQLSVMCGKSWTLFLESIAASQLATYRFPMGNCIKIHEVAHDKKCTSVLLLVMSFFYVLTLVLHWMCCMTVRQVVSKIH